ncbi:MAG: hypothetical protein CM15mP17_08330 [Gammaproteobacteria bacterium]|nr:MAG: hypothetical protein CM15mP17_08330 [Gammaproteobacteria bacterium]
MWQPPLLGETSGYSGSLDFTNFDDKNAIVANAGFTSFTVALTGTDHTYTGNSTDTASPMVGWVVLCGRCLIWGTTR